MNTWLIMGIIGSLWGMCVVYPLMMYVHNVSERHHPWFEPAKLCPTYGEIILISGAFIFGLVTLLVSFILSIIVLVVLTCEYGLFDKLSNYFRFNKFLNKRICDK